MRMNFAIGFMIIFCSGIALMLGVGSYLENSGYSDNQVLIAKFLIAIIFIAIPPLLLFFGGHNSDGDNKLEELGKPVTSFASFVGYSLSSPTSLIIFLLILIVNILVWK